MTLRYRPAPVDAWLALADRFRLLLVQAPENAPVIERLWAGISSLSGFQEVLDELTRDGLSSTPPFALLEWSDPSADEYAVRAIVRGGATVTVTRAPGDVDTLSGADVSTWTERSYPSATGFAVHVAESATGERGTGESGSGESGSGESGSVKAGSAEPGEAVVPLPLTAGAVRTRAVWSLAGALPHGSPTLPVEEQTSVPHGAEAEASAGGTGGGAEPPPASGYTLELSTGGSHDLSRPAIVGRSPSAGAGRGGGSPRFIAVPAARDISRSHVRLAVEGDRVVVTDLHSRNGTHVVLPGRAPQRLRAGEPMSVVAGTVVDLGGGITITVRRAGERPPVADQPGNGRATSDGRGLTGR